MNKLNSLSADIRERCLYVQERGQLCLLQSLLFSYICFVCSTGSGPVVLVLMHHSHEAKHVASVKTWTESSQILLHVNVFYHDKSNGLIACKENDEAISAIRDKLQSSFSY